MSWPIRKINTIQREKGLQKTKKSLAGAVKIQMKILKYRKTKVEKN